MKLPGTWPRSQSISRLNQLIFCSAIAVGTLVIMAQHLGPVVALRERISDTLLAPLEAQLAPHFPVVVAIDDESLERVGQWPWGRSRLADLVAVVAAAQPKAIAIDILLAGQDQRSPAALARQLAPHADPEGQAALQLLMPQLEDGDPKLVAAMARVPVVLGAALGPQSSLVSLKPSPMPVLGQVAGDDFWRAPSWVTPPEQLAHAASGLGILALMGDPDGTVRRAPLVTLVGGRPVPGLALELFRAAKQEPILLLDGNANAMRVGAHLIPLGHDASLRLLAIGSHRLAGARVSGADLLEGMPSVAARLKDKTVLIGGTAPELGGLRPRADGRLISGVDLQATAYAQLAAGVFPMRPAFISWLEGACILLAAVVAGLITRQFGPMIGGGLVLLAGVGWVVTAFAAAQYASLIVDAAMVPLAAVTSFTICALLVAADSRRRAERLQSRFEQHLAPAVVRRIIEKPESLRLNGELREVTAMFTDIASFSTMTENSDPASLIEVLDEYFDGLTRLAVQHEGLVDKFVGDAMHALFNAPLDLEDHALKALECALAIDAFSRTFRKTEKPRTLGLGQTRIGIETGNAIVGDVGGQRKLDYTAHGHAINAAARLEQANKIFDTRILIGPGAAQRIGKESLMPLGKIALRGLGNADEVFTPWPATIPSDRRTEIRELVTNPDLKSQTTGLELARLSEEWGGVDALSALSRRRCVILDETD